MTARDLGNSIITEIESNELQLAHLLRMNFRTGTDTIWTGYRSLTVDVAEDQQRTEEITFTGFGDLLRISTISEKKDISLSGIDIRIGGVKQEDLDNFINLRYQNRNIDLWLALFDNNGNVIDQPKHIFKGFMDKADFKENQNEITIAIKCENIYKSAQSEENERWSSTEQKEKYPNDKGLDFYKELRKEKQRWGVD